jgi:DNA-binding transcriptional regulator/RsmH inhibitor MraZ
VVIVGALDRIEIWSPERLQQELAGQSFAYDDLAEFVLGGAPPPTTETESEI